VLFLPQFVCSWKKCLSCAHISLHIPYIWSGFRVSPCLSQILPIGGMIMQSVNMFNSCLASTAWVEVTPSRVVCHPVWFHNLQNSSVFLSDFVLQYHSSILQYYVLWLVGQEMRKAVHRHCVSNFHSSQKVFFALT
jgi:hypothetical protein